jgi:hypothetical protein
MVHYLIPEAIFASMLMGFCIDYFSFGHEAWRDKIAFLFYLPGIFEGFNGGTIDRWLLGLLGHVVELTKHGGNAYLASANTNLVVGIVVAAVEIFTIGCLLPERFEKVKWLGKFATWRFPKSKGRIGWKLLGLAVIVGLLSDNVRGGVGMLTSFGITLDCEAAGLALNYLFVNGAWSV